MKNLLRTICLLVLICAVDSCGNKPKDRITAVTFNMYTGFDVETRVAEFETGGDPKIIAQEIINDFESTLPKERISLIAGEIVKSSPDFVGLQEVTLFTVFPTIAVDFLEELKNEIKAQGGGEYESIVIDNLTLRETIDTGTPIPASVAYQDREAVFYKKEFKIQGEAVKYQLPSHRDPVTFNGEEIIFYRGLVGARFKYGNDQLVSFFSTHLDQAYLGDIQKNQMQDILDFLREYSSDENLVLVGDFNLREADDTYKLAPAFGFTDTFRLLNPDAQGFTCCNVADLSNLEPTASEKIDTIFYLSDKWEPVESRVSFNTRNSIWPSDHFGVTTVFERIK